MSITGKHEDQPFNLLDIFPHLKDRISDIKDWPVGESQVNTQPLTVTIESRNLHDGTGYIKRKTVDLN